ncbi:uncharacterized protein LOC122376463 [Amphibalanus amphitrite]|uniref:uncharacterized protein LOC122376463 n=1 Tax=Amphibalanus amphitrite TaxID=1232801 RepID=UPI001C901649|nr:uncharacterized protein LOC122376463 [Amphibalanus amphitrite]
MGKMALYGMLRLLFVIGAARATSFISVPSDVTLSRDETAQLTCELDEPVTCAWRLEGTALNSSGFLNTLPPPLVEASSPLHPTDCSVTLTHPDEDYTGRYQCAPYTSDGAQILSGWAAVHVESSDVFTCPEESGTYLDEYDCRYFYVCIGGTPVHEMCPDPLVFNPSLLNCDYVEDVPECQ